MIRDFMGAYLRRLLPVFVPGCIIVFLTPLPLFAKIIGALVGAVLVLIEFYVEWVVVWKIKNRAARRDELAAELNASGDHEAEIVNSPRRSYRQTLEANNHLVGQEPAGDARGLR